MEYLRLLRQHPRYIGYGLLHYFFSSPGQTFFLSLFVPYWLIALHIDNLEFGSLYSGATLLSAFTLPWLGKLLDQVRLRHFSLGVGIAYMMFCLIMAQMEHPIWLFLALFGLRLCGQGLMGLTASTAIARYFEGDRGKALSLIGFGVSLGELALPLLIVFVLGFLSWQVSWMLTACAIGIIFLPLVLWLIPKNDPFQFATPLSPSQTSTPQTGATRKQVLKDPIFYLILAIFLCPAFFYTGVIIHKNLLGEANGWSEILLAQALSVFGLSRLLGNLFVGPLIDRLSAVRVFGYALLPMILACLAFLLSNQVWVLFLFFWMGGLSGSLVSLTGTAILAEMYGTAHLGAIRSMVTTVMVVATAAAPIVLGWALSNPADHWATMGIAAAVMIILSAGGIIQIGKLPKIA